MHQNYVTKDYRRTRQRPKENIHECDLPEKEEIMVHYIDNGYFVTFRRKFRTFLMVCDTNPLSKIYLKSSAAIRLEKTRHLHYHYYMIHPFSTGRVFWEMFMLVVLSMLFILIPFDICMDNSYLIVPKIFLDVFNIIDIVLTFNTGYLKPNTHKIIMNRGTVARNYIFGLFIFDVITSFNVFIVIIFLFFDQHHLPNSLNICIKMVNYLRLFRLLSWIRYLERFRQWKQYNIYKFKVVKLALYYLLTIWWCACVLYVMLNFNDSTSSIYTGKVIDYNYLMLCVYQATYMLVLIGYGEEVSSDFLIITFQMVVIILGNIMHIYTISQILHIVNKYHSSGNKYNQMIQQLQEFMRHKSLPDKIQKRILKYFDFRFQKNYFKEKEILGTLSKNLRQEIFVHTCKSLLENVKIFRNVPNGLLVRMISCMRSEIYLTNDLIVHANTDGDVMYFIYTGSVAVYTIYGKEVCHLTEGANFGEIALVLENEKRVASVVAVDSCELFTLSRRDFYRACEPYPEFLSLMRNLAKERLRLTTLATVGTKEAEDAYSESSVNESKGADTIAKDRSKTIIHYHI